jgi:hypothetical protein
MNLECKTFNDIVLVAKYMTEAVKQTPSRKYPRFWDLKDLIVQFEKDKRT